MKVEIFFSFLNRMQVPTFEGGGTLRLCVFSCRWGASDIWGSMPGSFTPGDAPSLTGGTEDSWPDEESRKK